MDVAGALRRATPSCARVPANRLQGTCRLPPLRFASGPARTPRGKPRADTPRSVKRFVPEEASRFVTPDGRLLTTLENRDFFLEHGIEPDNGRMTRFAPTSELSRLCADLGTALAYSPRHVIHPHDLRYFEPRGHPLAVQKRSQYAAKARRQPLWIMTTSAGAGAAVVRTLTQRRLTRSVYEALDALGYRSAGGDGGGGANMADEANKANKIRGTLWIAIHQPLKAASQPAERFGRVVAQALAKHCGL
ncbi:uncharacterized protein UV8b_04386 [Ustilaginoidea virens]|uniref:Uncharacterized protein n=1 Tax=Ustilaginoidea virens TaxID=1159556 RepID=A0A063C6N8_USTVR|nr:uncharacterized protein UV8b_04386 [Ustilaginoidea virens]QUC20145.1 hypothetical protein UV8b_04386 [Ustilaginoidea virens]GAO18323.1 hypothetical protein UVI_02032880 [Ustilaginoidea virens]